MGFAQTLGRIAARLGLRARADPRSAAGLVAAVVGIDSSHEGGDRITTEQEEHILAGLIRAIEVTSGGTFDGAERSSTQVLWYFFGSDVRAPEDALLPVLRREPRCRGGVLRLTRNGVVGLWHEIRI